MQGPLMIARTSYLTIYFSKPQNCLYIRAGAIQIHSFKARRSKLCMWPLLIVSSVMGGMRLASAASEAIEAEVSLKVWDVLHGNLRWASEADGPCEAGLCNLRG